MQPSASTPDPQVLLEHLDWVRRLARSLVADPNVADDLVQDTWIAYAQHPPRTTHLRAWLAEVTRNAARQLRRRESRRTRQESQAARPEAVPSSLEMLAKVSSQRRVVEFVMALDEPYRHTVLLRYFEDLSPATIAERTGVPLATVRTRLRRALAILRDRLDRAHAGDGSWLAALLPLVPKSADISSAAAGALVMSTKTIVVTAASLALLATGISTWVATGNANSGTAGVASAPATDAPAAEHAMPPDDTWITSSPREAQGSEPQPVIAAPAKPAVSATQIDPSARPTRVRVHVATPDGQPFEPALEQAILENFEWKPLVFVTDEPTEGPAIVGLAPEALTALGTFTERPQRSALPLSCIGELELASPPPAYVTLALFREWLGCEPLAPSQEDVHFVLDPTLFASGRSGVCLRVVDRASKLPVQGASVSISTGTGGWYKQSYHRTRADGSVSVQPWPGGPSTISVQKQGYAQVVRDVVLVRGDVADLGNIEIYTAIPIRVRVLTDLPREQYSVYAIRADELRSGSPFNTTSSAMQATEDGASELYPAEGETVLQSMTTGQASTHMQSQRVIVTPAQAGTTVELELHELVSVVLHTGWIGEGRTIEIRDALDIPEWRPGSFETSPLRLQLVPGTYRVIFAGEAPAPAARIIQVGDSPTEITLD